MGLLQNLAMAATKPLQKIWKGEANLAAAAAGKIGLNGVGKGIKKASDKFIDLQNKVLAVDAVRKYAKISPETKAAIDGDPLDIGGGDERSFDKDTFNKIFNVGPVTGWVLKVIFGGILIVLFYRVYLMASPYKRKRR